MGDLKKELRERLLESINYQKQMEDEELSELIDGEIFSAASERPLTLKERMRLQRKLWSTGRNMSLSSATAGLSDGNTVLSPENSFWI